MAIRISLPRHNYAKALKAFFKKLQERLASDPCSGLTAQEAEAAVNALGTMLFQLIAGYFGTPDLPTATPELVSLVKKHLHDGLEIEGIAYNIVVCEPIKERPMRSFFSLTKSYPYHIIKRLDEI